MSIFRTTTIRFECDNCHTVSEKEAVPAGAIPGIAPYPDNWTKVTISRSMVEFQGDDSTEYLLCSDCYSKTGLLNLELEASR